MNPRLIGTVTIALFLALAPALTAQQTIQIPSDTPPREKPEPQELPRQFRQLVLGMSLDDLKDNLVKDTFFNFRGDRDVSFLPVREQSLVETTGSSFIKRAFFQLRDGNVFIMSFSLNTEIVDHYSIFTQFVEKYGEPGYLDPKMAIWETEETRISLERPLTVKYIDRTVFNDIISESGLIESNQVQLRRDFINEF
jgi:hypothetical protein